MNVVPQLAHSCTAARHSMIFRLMPLGVTAKSSIRLILGRPVTFIPFVHRVISVPPHLGHFLLVISICRLTLSLLFSSRFGLFQCFLSILLACQQRSGSEPLS